MNPIGFLIIQVLATVAALLTMTFGVRNLALYYGTIQESKP